MNDTTPINILLADDDKDDCMFFKEALEEIQLKTTLTTVHNGEQLMHLLNLDSSEIFHILFLDLNMPRKNGFACLTEIKSSKNLKKLPVIIFSTSYDKEKAELLYKNGAQHYICNPSDFSTLKKEIHQAITNAATGNNLQPPKEIFLLSNLRANLL